MHHYTVQNKVKTYVTTSKLKLAKHLHNYNTRYSTKNNNFLLREQTEIGKKSFAFVGAKIWQDVPYELKRCSFPVFKRKLKTHLLSNYLYST